MEPDLQLYSVRTDLALEAKEMAQSTENADPWCERRSGRV